MYFIQIRNISEENNLVVQLFVPQMITVYLRENQIHKCRLEFCLCNAKNFIFKATVQMVKVNTCIKISLHNL